MRSDKSTHHSEGRLPVPVQASPLGARLSLFSSLFRPSRLGTFAFLSLLISGILVGIVPVSPVQAAGGSSAEERARAYGYYKAVRHCVTKMKTTIIASAEYDGQATKPLNGYWFGDSDGGDDPSHGNPVDVIPYKNENKNPGRRGCAGAIDTALTKYWNISYVDFLKGIGYSWKLRDQGDLYRWVYSSANGSRPGQLDVLLQSRGISISNSNAIDYFANIQAFNTTCSAKKHNDTTANKSNADSKQEVDGRKYRYIYVVDGTATKKQIYSYDMGVSWENNLYQGNGTTCAKIADVLADNKYAKAYIDELLTDKCAAAGVPVVGRSADAQRLACIDGAKHPNPGNEDYCNTKYSGAAREACQKGQGVKITAADVPGDQADSGTTTDEEQTSCAIEGVGWILCPVLTAGANIADAAFGFIAGSFLEISPDLLGDGTRTAWSAMQGFANAGFIIIFLLVIFSHLTQVGLSNYGVKRTLPRLVVAAILVNLSFLITQIAVDLSNILGYSLKEMLAGIAQSIQTSSGAGGLSTGDDSTNFLGIVTVVIAAAAFSWINLGAVIMAVVAAVVTLLTVFLILALRKALIVLLIALAPLAFVAYVLPNTKKLFDRWMKMFTGLLLVFPIIGLLYGGSLLAHTILWTAAGGDTIMEILAYVVLVVPLIATVPLLKGSLNAVGNIGGYVNAMGAKAKGSASKAAGGAFDRSRLGQFQKYRKGVNAKRRAQRQAGTDLYRGGGKNPLNWGSRMNRGLNKVSGRFGDDMATRGAAIEAKEDAELMQNATAQLSSMRVDGDKPLSAAHVMEMATTGAITINGKTSKVDDHMQRAAIQRAVQTATVKEAEQLVDASSGMSVDARKTLSSALAASSASKKAPHLGGKTLGDIEQGTANSARAALEAVQKGKYTAEALANSDADTIKSVLSAVSSTAAGSLERTALKGAYAQMGATPDLSSKVAAGGAHDTELKRILGL